MKFFGPSDVGVKAFTYAEGAMVLTVTGGFSFSTRTVFAKNICERLLSDWRRRESCTRKPSTDLRRERCELRIYQRCLVSTQGVYNFNGTATGLGMGDLLTGRLTSLMQLTPVLWSARQTYVAPYVPGHLEDVAKSDCQWGRALGTISAAVDRLRSGSLLNEGVSF